MSDRHDRFDEPVAEVGAGTFIVGNAMRPVVYQPQYFVTKTFGHDLGLSAAFRQWRADSHCHFVHGYALAIELTFVANSLDSRNWVIDFGAFSEVRTLLKNMFDHKLLVAEDDPQLSYLIEGGNRGVFDVEIVRNVGCECFAELVYTKVETWLKNSYEKSQLAWPKGHWNNVRLDSVKVSEHGANSASYRRQYV